MFEHGMTEARNNRVNISDIGPEVLGEMLRFMYKLTNPYLFYSDFILLFSLKFSIS
jgi:hypothetical protein